MSESGKMIDDKTARFERLLPGPIDRVWDYLTKAEQLGAWLGVGEIEPRVGAKVALGMLSDDPDAAVQKSEPHITGEVLKCEPPHLLSYTWIAHRPGATYEEAAKHTSIVTFELTQRGDQVLLTLEHEPILPDFRSRTLAGWHSLLDVLESRINGEPADSFMNVFTRVHPNYERRELGNT